MREHISRIDLTRDYEAHREEYREAIEKVCRETAFSGGKYADLFDREFAEYVGVPYACGVNNGTSALHLAMLAMGVGPGDEVIVPANTYIATAWGGILHGGHAGVCGLYRGYLGAGSGRRGGCGYPQDQRDSGGASLRAAL